MTLPFSSWFREGLFSRYCCLNFVLRSLAQLLDGTADSTASFEHINSPTIGVGDASTTIAGWDERIDVGGVEIDFAIGSLKTDERHIYPFRMGVLKPKKRITFPQQEEGKPSLLQYEGYQHASYG